MSVYQNNIRTGGIRQIAACCGNAKGDVKNGRAEYLAESL